MWFETKKCQHFTLELIVLTGLPFSKFASQRCRDKIQFRNQITKTAIVSVLDTVIQSGELIETRINWSITDEH